MKGIINILIILLLFLACDKKDKIVEDYIPVNSFEILYNDNIYMDSLRNEVIKNGNPESFEKLYEICISSANTSEEFYFSTIMAKKYNYPKAYYYLFIHTRYMDSKELDKMAVYYLLKSYEGNCEESKYAIMEIFKDKKIPKSSDYLMIQDTTKLVKIPTM